MALPAPAHAHRNTYWRDRTEKELLKQEFTTSEPELLAGMSEAAPPQGAIIVEFKYDLKGRKGTKSKARCVHCKFPNHYKGFVIKVSDGTRRMVGKDCGRKLYGAHFTDSMLDFDAAYKHAKLLKRRQRLIEAEPILTAGLARLSTHRSLAQFASMASRVRSVLGRQLIATLDGVAKRGDGLTYEEKVRDLAAEERASENLSPEHVAAMSKLNRADLKRYRKRHGLPDAERYTYIKRPIGPLRGIDLLHAQFMPADRLEQLAKELRNSIGALRLDQKWGKTSLALASKQLSELIGQIERQVEKLRAPIEFFDHAHLKAICAWVQHQPTGSPLECGVGWIGYLNEYDEPVHAQLVAGYEVPSTEFIAAFWAAVEQPDGEAA